MNDDQTTRLVVMIEPALRATLVQLCERNDRTLSDQVRHLIKQAIAQDMERRKCEESQAVEAT